MSIEKASGRGGYRALNFCAKVYLLFKNILRYYLDFHISRASAGLSYFLMLTIFPLIICLYSMLGSMFPAVEELKGILDAILPETAVNILTEYLGYVRNNVSPRMLSFALAAMATSSAAGFRIIDKLMFELRGTRRSERSLAFIFSFVFSLIFLAALYLAALLMATGGRFLHFVDRYIPFINISQNWQWFRFVLLFLLLFVMILGVYRVTAPRDREVLFVPGAISASVALLCVSIFFSWFISFSARYPLLYGSLASIMIMLLWLYICGSILFLGNILNITLENMK